MKFSEVAVSLHRMGYQVTPVNGKVPTLQEWQSMAATEDQVKHWASNGKANCNTGVITGKGPVPIYASDVDFYDPEVASRVRKSFWAKFGDGPLRIGQKPKSLTVYRGDPGFAKITSPTYISPDGVEHKFEMLGLGQQFVAYGTHPDTGLPYEWPTEFKMLEMEPWELNYVDMLEVAKWVKDILPTLIPADWIVKGRGSAGGAVSSSDDPLDNIKPRCDITLEELAMYVECLDPEDDYDSWTNTMFGVHHQTGGSEEGFAIFDAQSRRSSKYDARTTRYKWDKIRAEPRHNEVTAASIIFRARQTQAWKDKQVEAAREAADSWNDRIAACQDAEELETLCAEIGVDRSLSVTGKLRVEGVLIARFGDLGVRMTKTSLREIFKQATRAASRGVARQGGAGGVGMGAGNEWCEPYVWCKFDDCFIHTVTQEHLSVQSFNATHGRDVRGRWVDADGRQMRASEVALQELQIPIVHRQMYLPSAPARFEMDGLEYLNSYRPDLVPEEKLPTDWTAEEAAAVEAYRRHIELFCRDSYWYLVKWLAHNVQFPGVKVRHAPLIKGIPGDGKNIIAEGLAQAIGIRNVTYIAPKVLLTDFNGWAEGHCVGIFDEIRMPGHNRHDSSNAIKPVITNDSIAVHRKGKDQYNIPNTQNYLLLTNYGDAIPIDDTDRRYHVIFSPFSTVEELSETFNDQYFDALFDAVRNHFCAIRGWLMSIDLSDFDANGRAPDSVYKKSMAAASRHDIDEAIMELMEKGAPGVSKTVISTHHLNTALLLLDGYEGGEIVTKAFGPTMARLNFMKAPKRIKWRGVKCHVWARRGEYLADTPEARKLVRDALNSTIPEHEVTDEDEDVGGAQ